MLISLPLILSISFSLIFRRSSPSNIAFPSLTLPVSTRSRSIDIIVTLFPQPDSPTIPTASALFTSKETPLTALTSPAYVKNEV